MPRQLLLLPLFPSCRCHRRRSEPELEKRKGWIHCFGLSGPPGETDTRRLLYSVWGGGSLLLTPRHPVVFPRVIVHLAHRAVPVSWTQTCLWLYSFSRCLHEAGCVYSYACSVSVCSDSLDWCDGGSFRGVCVCLRVSWCVLIGGSSRSMSLTGWITVISHYWLPVSVLHTPLGSSVSVPTLSRSSLSLPPSSISSSPSQNSVFVLFCLKFL